jgi:hypothetical protein
VDIAGRIETGLARIAVRPEFPALIPPPIPVDPHEVIMARWFANRSADTIRSYATSLRGFATWARKTGRLPAGRSDADAVLALADIGGARANLIVQDWIDAMISAGAKQASVVARLSAVKSLCVALVAAERDAARRRRELGRPKHDTVAGLKPAAPEGRGVIEF